jgi:2-oxoglutarate/2-oxoacid ferredoxin oxidoreductase subunit alpha
MHTLAKQLPCYGGIVHQAEDEIAAIGAAIGSYYGGVPAATATSGPGLSLKQEYIGYAAAAEIPVIIIDAQRSGPSTGMPTKTEQSDLPAALWGTHGDATKIIFSVANILDCFYAPHVARYLAEKLKLPVFIMSDFQTANSYKVVDKLKPVEMADSRDIPDFVLDRFFINRIEADVETVRTQQDVPGTAGGMRRVTGLNTDEEGKVNYFWRSNQRSHEVRNQKIHHVRQALKIPEMFGPEEGELLIIGWGSTRGIIEESIGSLNAEGLSAAGMHLKFVYPLPLMLKDIFQKYKKVVTIELAYGDDFKPAPLASLLRMETAFPVQNGISKVKGRPISPKSIMKYVHGVFQ